MPFTFSTGMPYKCPSDGRLVVIILNDESVIRVRFLSYVPPGTGEYRGLKKLCYLTDSKGSYADKGLSFGRQPLNTAPYAEVTDGILMLIINAGRYAIDEDFKLSPNDPAFDALSKEARKKDRVVTILKPLGPPANFAPH